MAGPDPGTTLTTFDMDRLTTDELVDHLSWFTHDSGESLSEVLGALMPALKRVATLEARVAELEVPARPEPEPEEGTFYFLDAVRLASRRRRIGVLGL